MYMTPIVFKDLHIFDLTSDKTWVISGEFSFDDDEAYRDFITQIEDSFSHTFGYTVVARALPSKEVEDAEKAIDDVINGTFYDQK
jgi:hypothetical protein